MTRHARRGNKKSVLPGATQWTQLKQKNYTSLKEDDDGDDGNQRGLLQRVKKKSLKASNKAKLKTVKVATILTKKKLKGTLDDSESVPLLVNGSVNEENSQPKNKSKSVTFGENSFLIFQSTSRKSEKRNKNAEARKLRRWKQRVTCFKCRQPGHKVDDCPDRGKKEDVAGICFKCGSAEHTSRACRVAIGAGEYPYAKCFICKEVGHLARSCPDNPRGLYPNGGSCRLCGSVEHLKVNCPEKNSQQSAAGESSGLGLVIKNEHASADADDPLPTSNSAKKTTRKSKATKNKFIKF